MKFPVLIIKKNEAPLYYFEAEDFGLVSKGGETFYENGMIFDSGGSKFLINDIDSIRKAPLLKSIRYFQQMYIANVKYLFVEQLPILEFKQLIVDHIYSFENYWIKKI